MRFAPDERVPVARRYEPGTNVIETTWATETGWVIVRDALIVNAVRTHDGRNRLEAERMLVRWAHCPEGHAEIELVCDALPDYGRGTIDWDLDAELGVATAEVDGVPLRFQADMDLELDDGRIWGVALARHRRERVLRADLVGRGAPPRPRRRGGPAGLRDRPGLAALARARQVPRPSLARRAAALGADPEGPDVRADRRHGRGADDVAAGIAGRRAQLGLPLHLDPRRDLHALGAARARPRRRGPRLHGLRRAGDRRRRRAPPDHVRDRRREGADREHPRPPQRLHRLEARADRQRRLLAAPERRLRRPARLDLHPLAGARRRQRRALEDRLPAGRGRDGRSGSSPTRGSGRRAASRSTTCPRS